MSFLIPVLSFCLTLVSLFVIFIVLAQPAKSDGGMGAAMGGGMAEATFGAETSSVLSKATVKAAVVFFVLSLILYLTRLGAHKHEASGSALPVIPVSTVPVSAPAAGAPPAAALTIPAASASAGSAPAAPAPVPATPAPAPAKQP